MERQAWLDHALECEYVKEEVFTSLDDAWQQIGAMLNGMIEKVDAFCPTSNPR
jgi:hypothetical protein